MLESYKHDKCAFVTLTYDDKKLKDEEKQKAISLDPSDLQRFLKRLRHKFPHPIRFYGCGEYGEDNFRAHFHLALFSVGPEDKEAIDEAWDLGFTFVGDLTNDSAEYVAGYVTKKMNHPESKCTPKCTHPKLNGRHPEFSRMSLRPGIGAVAVPDIVDTLTSPAGCDALADVGDVPAALVMEKKSIPLGKYLRSKLREKLNFPDKKTPPEALARWKAEMQELQKEYVSTKSTKALSKYFDERQHFKQFLIDKNAQKVLQLEKRNKIFSTKRNKV